MGKNYKEVVLYIILEMLLVVVLCEGTPLGLYLFWVLIISPSEKTHPINIIIKNFL